MISYNNTCEVVDFMGNGPNGLFPIFLWLKGDD